MIITVVGIGLIGGSLAITLRENGFASQILGVDLIPDNQDKALRRRIIDEAVSLEEGIEKGDLILLATPVDALQTLLPRVLDQINSRHVVIDVGSTKGILLDELADHPMRDRYVATHPMAGTEFSGPEAAIPNLFDGKVCVLVEPEQSAPDAVQKTKALYRSIPMELVEYDREAHDRHTAYVSHISHISSFALALTVLEKEQDENRIFELASAGFASTVRLAKSSADMWVPIFRQNRDNVLDVLDEHINQLARFRSLLIKKDFETFYALIEEANQIRRILAQKSTYHGKNGL